MLQDANVFASHIDMMMQQTLGVSVHEIEEEEEEIATEADASNEVEEEEEEDSSARDEL